MCVNRRIVIIDAIINIQLIAVLFLIDFIMDMANTTNVINVVLIVIDVMVIAFILAKNVTTYFAIVVVSNKILAQSHAKHPPTTSACLREKDTLFSEKCD